MQCVLSINETLTVGSIQINVIEVRHDSVRLGIDDPDASPSYREETLYLQSDDDDTDGGMTFDSTYQSPQSNQFRRYAFSIL